MFTVTYDTVAWATPISKIFILKEYPSRKNSYETFREFFFLLLFSFSTFVSYSVLHLGLSFSS